jgi:murein L,D-transpeptidase YcbB/YkuD
VDARVVLLRRRLVAEGYRPGPPPGDSARYDSTLSSVVRRFQETHGLEPDGVVGRSTLRELNVPASRRVTQIIRNLERGRVIPGRRYLVVNIPAFQLELVEDGRRILELRTIVGRPDWPTPVTQATVTELVFRPVWRVPGSIATREILPRVRRDPEYLRRIGMRALPSGQLVQEPGPANPLGGVKFVMHTPYGVFLHDTPARLLFESRQRALSHGCIRIEHAERLAAYLLPAWTEDSIRSAMATGRDRRVPVPDPLPVRLVYRTAWREPDGLIAFREDIYRRD